MGACDAHGAIWQSAKEVVPGEGYLLAARFMQNSSIQEKMLDRDMPMMTSLGFTREEYKAQLESLQGLSPWLVCEECIGLLGLGSADKEAAREAARKWWADQNTPGHMPASGPPSPERLPAYFAVFGNGFMPSEEQARLIFLAWWAQRKSLFGQTSAPAVRFECHSRPQASRLEFAQARTEMREATSGQAMDDWIWIDKRTGQDMVLLAVWPPEEAAAIRDLL